MEGNTYDILQTEQLLRYGEEASGKDRKYEINNLALLRDVFIEAYRASANNYKALRARLASVQRRQGHALGNLPVPKTAHKFF